MTGDSISEVLKDGEIKRIEKKVEKKKLLNLNDFIAAEYDVQF